MSQIDEVLKVWMRSKIVLIFTGAGISTASGIPDFRGPTGLWKKWKPVYYQDFLASNKARLEYWKFKIEGWDALRLASPNQAHRALVKLQISGRIHKLITQNIDGLHQLAGHPQDAVIELHGTNRLVECVHCNQQSDSKPAYEYFRRTNKPPLCKCGGFLKPATISFGQEMPQEPLRIALKAANLADLVVSIGSSLTVEPAASIPLRAKKSGAFYVIVNQGSTAHDSYADIIINKDVTDVLPRVASRLLRT